MKPTIVFENVSKKFSRGYVSDSLRDTIAAPFRRLFGRDGRFKSAQPVKQVKPTEPVKPVEQAKPAKQNNEFWALKDVSFEVRPGEVLGIIGPNGSGKSTTLKLLSRILRPDGGKIMVKGRVGALIELAAGFHPDLTGRENVFLNASILGMDKREIERKYDEIVDFAELQEFMDTPVKWYSSGMHARLGFSIAAHIDPEILLVDEVLSVGDIGFQQKCEKKIQGIKEKGLTIVFVSHNMSTISAVCDRVLVLGKGQTVFCGAPEDAIIFYSTMQEMQHEADSSIITLKDVCIRDCNGTNRSTFVPGEDCSISLHFITEEMIEMVNIGIRFRKKENKAIVFGAHYSALTGGKIFLNDNREIKIVFSLSLNLSPGNYVLEAYVWDETIDYPLLIRQIATLTVKETIKMIGTAFLNPKIAELSLFKSDNRSKHK